MILSLLFYFVSGLCLIFIPVINLFVYVTSFLVFLFMFLFLNYSPLAGIFGVFYVDGVSNNLVILRVFITLLMVYSSYKVSRYNEHFSFYTGLMVLLLLFLFLTFYIRDLLMFYFYFEISLIPTLIIIVGWGYQPERLQAGVYFIFYTLFASLPLLLFVNFIYQEDFTLRLYIYSLRLGWINDKLLRGWLIFLAVLTGSLAFLVKLPIYFGHL